MQKASSQSQTKQTLMQKSLENDAQQATVNMDKSTRHLNVVGLHKTIVYYILLRFWLVARDYYIQ